MEEKITFGKFIIKKRKERNLTQRELADQLFVTESAVSKWERGISYPDISLVSSLCSLLEISEHELITSSEDVSQKEMERQAETFLTLKKVYSVAFYIIYGLSLLTCFVVNLAVTHKLSWFFIVFAAELTAFSLTSLPLLLKKKYRGILTCSAFLASVILLLAVCCVYVRGDWFGVVFLWILFAAAVTLLPFLLRDLPLPASMYEHKTLICFAADTILLLVSVVYSMWYSGIKDSIFSVGLPVTAVMILLAWTIMIVIRYAKINGFLKTAACLFMTAVYTFFINSILTVIIDHKPFAFLSINYSIWSGDYINGNITFIIVLFLVGASVLFSIGGIMKSLNHKSVDNSSDF